MLPKTLTKGWRGEEDWETAYGNRRMLLLRAPTMLLSMCTHKTNNKTGTGAVLNYENYKEIP